MVYNDNDGKGSCIEMNAQVVMLMLETLVVVFAGTVFWTVMLCLVHQFLPVV